MWYCQGRDNVDDYLDFVEHNAEAISEDPSRYLMPGTAIVYAAVPCYAISGNGRTLRDVQYWNSVCCDACYAMSGTKVAYCAAISGTEIANGGGRIFDLARQEPEVSQVPTPYAWFCCDMRALLR